jgi:hypothetical protein
MSKIPKIHDIRNYKAAQINVVRLAKLLKDLDKMEELAYNNIKYGPIFWIAQRITELRVRYNTEMYEWEEMLKNKGSVDE